MVFQYPLRKLFNDKMNINNFINKNFYNQYGNTDSSEILPFINNTFQNNSQSNKTLTLLSSNQNILPSDQNLRQYDNLTTNKLNFNLSGKSNTTLDFNTSGLTQSYYQIKSNFVNSLNFYKLSSNQINLTPPYAPIFTTNNTLTNSLNFDSSNIITEELRPSNQGNGLLDHNYILQKTNAIGILKGKRDGAPEFLNSAY
jgi:hypothetical protein